MARSARFCLGPALRQETHYEGVPRRGTDYRFKLHRRIGDAARRGSAFPRGAWERGWMLARWLVVLLLLGGLPILLHGCHGDEDNELFAPSLRHLPNLGRSGELDRLWQFSVELGK